MIRINLMPNKKIVRRKGEAGADVSEGGSQAWLVFVLGAVLLEVIVLLFVYKTKQDQLTQAVKHNQEIKANIDAISREIANHAQIKAELKELRDREEAIQKLQSARTGPTVDRDKLEQLKRDNPSAVPNVNWDPRRLWMTSYKEDNRMVRIVGLARDGEDVSEFLRRLSLSDYFYEVRLLPATKGIDAATHLELVKFEMSAKVRY